MSKSKSISVNKALNSLGMLKSKEYTESSVNKIKSFIPDYDKLKKRHDEDLVFSFSLLDRDHEAFNLGNVDASWFLDFLDAIKEVSKGNWVRLKTELYGTYEAHDLDFTYTNYKFGFDNATLEQNQPCQFRISKSKGRVHGFLVGNIFYVYWLDPHHNMYDSEGYGGIRLYKAPNTLYEILEQQYCKLSEEKEMIVGKLNEAEELYYEQIYKCDDCEYKNSIK